MIMQTELTACDKRETYNCVLSRMYRWYGEDFIKNGMSCLYFMHAGLATLATRGIRCWPAAGSAHFQIIEPEQDDGKCATHFGFEWEGGPGAISVPGVGQSMPEMHCWIWLPDTAEIVDFSVGSLPALAKRMGFNWAESLLPPPFVWGTPASLLPRCVYKVNGQATTLAVAHLLASMKGKEL